MLVEFICANLAVEVHMVTVCSILTLNQVTIEFPQNLFCQKLINGGKFQNIQLFEPLFWRADWMLLNRADWMVAGEEVNSGIINDYRALGAAVARTSW